jgi:hypothetical protein
MNWKIGSRGGRQAVPTKGETLDILTGQEAGTTGRGYELKPRKRHNLPGSA